MYIIANYSLQCSGMQVEYHGTLQAPKLQILLVLPQEDVEALRPPR